MKKETKIFILIIVIIVALVTALDIQTKGKITSLIALDLKSSDVPYTNNGQSTVQGAIDDLYNGYIARTLVSNRKNNTVYFACGEPTTSSTTDYTTLNNNVFISLNGRQKSVCIIKNNLLHCFDSNNWVIEKDHLQQVFKEENCNLSSNHLYCRNSDIECNFYPDGIVDCRDIEVHTHCFIRANEEVLCESCN